MIDQIFDREYQSGRADLNAGIDRLLIRTATATRNVFGSLQRIRFDAPWARRRRGPGRA